MGRTGTAITGNYRQRTRSFYVGKTLPVGVEPIIASDDTASRGA